MSNLGDRVVAEVKQFEQEKQSLNEELLEVGLNSTIFENNFAIRRIREHQHSIEQIRGFLNSSLD